MARLISKPKKASDEADELMSTTQNVWEKIVENPTRTATIAGAVVAVVAIILLAQALLELLAQAIEIPGFELFELLRSQPAR